MSERKTPQPFQNTAEAVMRTLLYSDVFDFPLTIHEIHRFLIGQSASLQQVQAAMQQSSWLAQYVERVNGYYALSGRADNAALREQREVASTSLWSKALRYGQIVGALPFVRMVAVTGALAVNNAKPGDDIDYIIVTKCTRVWLTRLLVVATVKVASVFKVGLCPNYVLSEDALHQERHDLFTARELAQMVPLVGRQFYARMRAVNNWSELHLPNANVPVHSESDRMPGPLWGAVRRILEWVLGGKMGDVIEAWERERKIAKFKHQIASHMSDAILDEQHVKGHFSDHGLPTMLAYRQRLAAHGMTEVQPKDVINSVMEET